MLARVDRSLLWLPKVKEERVGELVQGPEQAERYFVLRQTCEHSKPAYSRQEEQQQSLVLLGSLTRKQFSDGNGAFQD